ncbi:purine phosphorylase [Petrotoga sp. 9T1HF07.CasAA.8.2]|uniref:nucleoside phosphorylase n=1 Tax=unclassified Petrotoga TaxID=2620614 RepID=UPI000CBF1B2F|nr:nucleoside phosphorylase [Petrotoga sp. 9T1HF07.CasAA.8.2]MBL5981066.1 purine phosphorylase [Petrotoga sp. 8T1HF07.NaAc.6.1]PNR89496.1 purine phosphorylase [Petrotoga sp. 9T1HF07.CasAA.8.2]
MFKQDFRVPTGLENQIQYHIQCGPGDVAPVVIVPGDQGRVESIISKLHDPKKVSENRGLITYTGYYEDYPVSVTSTGMGGPSASIVYEELINIGAKILIRIGSVAGLQEEIEEGDVIIPHACVRDDGASQYYVPQNFPAVASPEVYLRLISAAKSLNLDFKTGINWSHSCFYNRDPEYFQRWSRYRVVSMDMEASSLFVVSSLRGIKAGFIGICYANRFKQSNRDKVDLSVPDTNRNIIKSSTSKAIDITLMAIKDLYQNEL